MAEFVFDPPLRLARGVTVRTLDEASEFARKYVGAKWPSRRKGVLRRLVVAFDEESGRDAANSFQAWAEAEGLLEEK